MMRKTLIFVIVTLLALIQTGCHDFSYQGLHNVVTEEDEYNPQRVIMFIGSSTNIKFNDNDEEEDQEEEGETKGTGVIGSVEGFTEKSFYIYSFLGRLQKSSYSQMAKDDPMACLIDGSLDDPESVMGREAVWNPASSLIDWKYSKDPVFYPVGEALGLTYDFFAYYVDDMKLTNEDFRRTDDSVEIDIEIDGSQDIMSAVAVAADKELWYGTEDAREYAYRKECTYSYYTAQLNIHPRFIFKHHLTKLDFKLIPGKTPGFTREVKVEKIEVYSRKKADFVVAHRNHNHVGDNMGVFFKGEKSSLELKEPDGTGFQGRMVTTVAGEGPGDVVDNLGSLLVAPDQDYHLFVTLTEYRDGVKVSDSELNELHVYLGNMADPDAPFFEAGNEYMISMTIYGKMDIRVSTEVLKWGEGGDYIYDFDEEYWNN